MTSLLAKVRAKAAGLPAGYFANLDEVEEIRIEPGAILGIAGYLERCRLTSVLAVADGNTYAAAGRTLEELLARSSIRVQTARLRPDAKGDVIADEASLIQVILEIQRTGASAVLAVGGGTIHDISRYAAYTAGIPFVSVPTAASVDGFNSKGAPIIVRGEKTTIPAIGPSAIFADLDILMKAPQALAAAGFGDMLGKYTSLFDWKFGSLIGGEPYLELSADMTQAALDKCVGAADAISRRSEEGIATLMEALIESGLAMLLFGQSHPASGAEHHLSHYWEMEFIRLGQKQLLHGAKVGAACIEISRLYRAILDQDLRIWKNGTAEPGTEAELIRQRIAGHWNEIEHLLERVPEPSALTELIRAAGGPASVAELPLSGELVERSLREAHRVRIGRKTLLHVYNEYAR